MSESHDKQVQPLQVESLREGERITRSDRIAIEEPLEIRIAGEAVAVTMRTPGHDEELAAGFAFTEGVIQQADHLTRAAHAVNPQGQAIPNVVELAVDPRVVIDLERCERNFYATSSCGICGKASIAQIRQRVRPIDASLTVVAASLVSTLPDRMREAQRVFGETGGLHAAGLFSDTGELLCLREDVGRHNAVDKVIGWALLARRLPLDRRILMISGRASFEIVQKALVARVPVVAAVSAPSSLAVELARENNMTLVGFLRGASMNIYSGPQRIG